MALYPVAGSHIYIGNATADQSTDFVEGDFSAMTFVEIDGWQQMGALGDTAALISTDLINRGRTIKQKGTKNAGSMQNVFAIIADDAGQALLEAAAQTDDNYAFKITFPDGSTRYFIALVMTQELPGGEANTVLMINATLEINSNIVNVPAP